MGCQSSKEVPQCCQKNEAPGRISKRGKKIVQDTWLELKPDLKNFGLSIFTRLFDEAPEAQDLFYNFKDLKNQDELLQSLQELDHIARVMSSFGNCIELLDDIDQFSNAVQGLGKAHKKTGIRKEHLGVFGGVVMGLLADVCKTSWTIEKEKAWKEMFVLLTENFAIGLSEDTSNHVAS